jgi:hypothetical protein
MASKLRVDEIVGAQGSTVSIGTATFTGGLSGDITGLNVTGVITATTLNQTLGAGSSITIGNTVITSTSIGIGTTTTSGRNAGVGTANGSMIFNADTGSLEIYGDAGWETVKQTNAFTASGGTLDTSSRSGFNIHTFTTPGSFVASGAPKACEVLVIGGGGGGGTQHGGGGGAGGFRYSTSLTLSAGTYTIVRGSGGTGGPNAGGNQPAADPGTPSYIIAPGIVGFTSITATAGGDLGGNGGSGIVIIAYSTS